jgi:hypothetical protein
MAMTLEQRLARIEAMLAALIERPYVQEYYSVSEFARIVERSEFTCRSWFLNGRVRAVKKKSGRGAHAAWAIPHVELLRYQREGLLPPRDAALAGPEG